MARTSNKDRDVNEMVMGTFRIKSGMWEDFKQLASQNNATATDLIIGFIENCLQSQSIPQSIQDIDNNFQPNLDSIYTYIDSKLDNLEIQSRQNIDITNLDDIYTYIDNKLDNQSIQDIDDTVKKQINESIADGSIGEAIAKSYAAMMGQFNELLNQIEELKAAIPPAAASPQSPITNNQSPITDDQKLEIISLLGIGDIINGDQYWEDKLVESGINQKILQNIACLSEKLNIKLSPKVYIIARFNAILDALGYGNKKQGQHTKTDGKKQDKYIVTKQ